MVKHNLYASLFLIFELIKICIACNKKSTFREATTICEDRLWFHFENKSGEIVARK